MARRKTLKMFKFLILGLLVLGLSTPGYADLIGEVDQATRAGDYSTLVLLLAPLADAGDAEAQYRLAGLYRAGRGVERDLELAAELLHRAAGQGHATAQHSLGTMYMKGLGVPQDPIKAKFWFEAASEQEALADEANLPTSDPQASSGGTLNERPKPARQALL
jgi:hypothetical protein